MPNDDAVLGALSVNPEIVIRVANRIYADVFDVEAILKRLLRDGLVARYPAGPGVPVRWSRRTKDDAADPAAVVADQVG